MVALESMTDKMFSPDKAEIRIDVSLMSWMTESINSKVAFFFEEHDLKHFAPPLENKIVLDIKIQHLNTRPVK